MKKLIFLLAASAMALTTMAQTPWDTKLNHFDPEGETPKLGTRNGLPLYFYTDDTRRMTLDLDGNLQITNNLKLEGFTNPDATAYPAVLMVDANGWLTTQARQPGGSSACAPGAQSWVMGGNNASPGSPTINNVIGTCNSADFILKAGDVPMFFMKHAADQNFYGSTLLGIGRGNSSPESQLDVTDGITTTLPSRPGPDHTRIYGNYEGIIEATGKMNLLYQDNFAISTGLFSNVSNERFIIDHDGLIGVAQPPSSTARFAVTGAGYEGIRINQSATAKALVVYDNTGIPKFNVYGNGQTHVTNNMQIGYGGAWGIVDPTFRLNIETNTSANALKLLTGNTSGHFIYANNVNFAGPAFQVLFDGKTIIGAHGGSSNTALLNVNLASGNAIDISDGSAVNFRVKASGFVFARELEVMTATFPDYVFDAAYELKPLSEVEAFIKQNKHLPGFEKGAYYEENGIKTSEMFVKQQEKIEELTLYIIELQKRLEALENQTK